MKELTVEEMDEVGGGYSFDDIFDLSTQTGAVGSVVGYLATGTLTGATEGGLIGAGIGMAFGGGYGLGTWMYDAFIQRMLWGSY